ncbi:membrane protein [Nocardioides flavus (ex Wang et al. 2016)]|uniref:Membrane protein n=1 Tax=Nocardioides flavus (ex Wang et al. 2016) TaxID=2058780 RepID=A0ABQ3HFK7_9ACTN|nr:vitamin K epoxide reductase family protein [Nocardioides flavus (ex Wang et al. 2016)]GHE16377.1 membrane protein [Nocardioides flavus (ex Wang et al. 2016)]
MTLQAARRGTTGARPVRGADRSRVRGAWFAMLLWSAASLTASFVLAAEAVTLAAEPEAVFGCDINAVVSCGTVGSSWQASVFGFPNAFLGLVSEPVVLTLAAAGLSGLRLPRWMMLTAQVGYTLGLGLAYWLLHQAIFAIGAVCPWCLLVTVATTFVFVEMTRINVLERNLPLPRAAQRFLEEVVRHRLDLLATAVWLAGILLLLVTRYGSVLLG